MSEPSFTPGRHESHDWHEFWGQSSDEPTRLMCRRCEICTCHSPVASTEPCDYAAADQEGADDA